MVSSHWQINGDPSIRQRKFSSLSTRAGDDCVSPDPANTLTDRLNTLLNSSGPGYTLRLCPNRQYLIQAPILFAAPHQEISTSGYPTGDDRAILVVNGPVKDGQGHTTAVDGTCLNCSGVKLRNVQIDGTRGDAPPTDGGGNIEMGGQNSDQLIEYVRSFNPRSWTCLHIQEGALNCENVTIQNNDIGPCGTDNFQEWADGISVSCRNSIVRNNMVQNPTDGGIVVFGSPGTQVYNNTIWVLNQTLLGGINMVDYDPFSGDFTGTVVRDNTILGGFATDPEDPGDSKGTNFKDAIIKIGIAIGPRTWFGDHYGTQVCKSGAVMNNRLSGAFSYAMAVTSAVNFTVENNSLFGNTSFIGARGPNCSTSDILPIPAAFVISTNLTQNLTLQSDFQTVADGDSLTCVSPPEGGDFWPFGGNPSNSSTNANDDKELSSGGKAGIAFGVILGVIVLGVASWFIRKWVIKHTEAKHYFETTKQPNYIKQS